VHQIRVLYLGARDMVIKGTHRSLGWGPVSDWLALNAGSCILRGHAAHIDLLSQSLFLAGLPLFFSLFPPSALDLQQQNEDLSLDRTLMGDKFFGCGFFYFAGAASPLR